MKYCCFKAAAHAWQSRKLFILLAIQTVLGVALLFYSANTLLQSQASLHTAQKALQGQTVDVSYSLAQADVIGTDFPVSFEDLNALQTAYTEQADFLYAAFCPQTMVLSQENAEFLSIYCLFVNDAFFEETFGENPEKSTAYLGANVSAALADEQNLDFTKILYMTNPPVGKLEKNKVLVAEDASFPLAQMPAANVDLLPHPAAYAQAEDYIALADCIILPLECLPAVQALPQREGNQASVKIRYREDATKNIAPDVLATLSQRHEEYIYSVEDRYLAMEQSAQETGAQTRLLLLTALGLLLSLLLGTAGILSILLARRKQQLAVCIAYGATRGVVLLEAACEMLLVFAPAAVLGTALGWGLCIAAGVAVTGIAFLGAPLLVVTAVMLCLLVLNRRDIFHTPGRLLHAL